MDFGTEKREPWVFPCEQVRDSSNMVSVRKLWSEAIQMIAITFLAEGYSLPVASGTGTLLGNHEA